MTKNSFLIMAGVAIAFCVATVTASTQTFNTLASLNSTDGATPSQALVQGLDGNFYGTAAGGGIIDSGNCRNGCGTVFKITPQGKLTTLYTFCSQANCADGNGPAAPLLLASDGNFYVWREENDGSFQQVKYVFPEARVKPLGSGR